MKNKKLALAIQDLLHHELHQIRLDAHSVGQELHPDGRGARALGSMLVLAADLEAKLSRVLYEAEDGEAVVESDCEVAS